jgi:biopolymer transport protein ExbD
MMRIPSIAEPEESQSMSAMTDVVFLLLIFFIVTMSGYVEMTLLETSLPTASGAAATVDLQNSVKIELSAAGDYIISGVPQNRDHLTRLLRRYQRLMPDAEFLLQCDPDSKHHQLVTLLADLARHNLKNVKLLKS